MSKVLASQRTTRRKEAKAFQKLRPGFANLTTPPSLSPGPGLTFLAAHTRCSPACIVNLSCLHIPLSALLRPTPRRSRTHRTWRLGNARSAWRKKRSCTRSTSLSEWQKKTMKCFQTKAMGRSSGVRLKTSQWVFYFPGSLRQHKACHSFPVCGVECSRCCCLRDS